MILLANQKFLSTMIRATNDVTEVAITFCLVRLVCSFFDVRNICREGYSVQLNGQQMESVSKNDRSKASAQEDPLGAHVGFTQQRSDPD